MKLKEASDSVDIWTALLSFEGAQSELNNEAEVKTVMPLAERVKALSKARRTAADAKES